LLFVRSIHQYSHYAREAVTEGCIAGMEFEPPRDVEFDTAEAMRLGMMFTTATA